MPNQDALMVVLCMTDTQQCWYSVPTTEWPRLVSDPQAADLLSVNVPLLRKISDRPLILEVDEPFHQIEIKTADTCRVLFSKRRELTITTDEFENGSPCTPQYFSL